MPSSKARILVALIISSSLLIVAVSAQNQQQHNVNAKLPISGLGIHGDANINSRFNQGKFKQGRGGSLAREFLLAHNKVRFHFGEQPFQWDKGLARYARRFASKRIADCKMVHSFGEYGENIFWGGQDHWTPTDVVRAWISEHKFYNVTTNECAPTRLCGHYTQIVWRESVRLGCARITCNNGGMYAICSYDPPGNYVNESPFEGANNASAPPLTPPPTTLVPPTLVSPPSPPATVSSPAPPA